MTSHRVEFLRRKDAETDYFEIKDPSVVRLPDGSYEMYASLGTERGKPWGIGRFSAAHPGGPWQELEPAEIRGVTGAEVLAPAVTLEQRGGETLRTMYVQTTCFQENGVIACALSTDGKVFDAVAPAMTIEKLPAGTTPSAGLYDAAVSDVTRAGKPAECLVFSSYRSIGCGDVFTALRDKGAVDWETPKLALRQEDVPFHNKPGAKDFEWGLEGAKVVQLAEDAYLMIGVCFLGPEAGPRGTRQRVFFAAAAKPEGPYQAMETPIAPTVYPEGTGENGHPDTVDMGDKLGILYQERAGEGQPWHLRYTEVPKDELLLKLRAKLSSPENKKKLSGIVNRPPRL
jgi:hypothetical protein